MIFNGNPGTGKTTFARIIAEQLYNLGIIMENKVVEVEAKDLIAGYVGQTAPKTAEQVEKALGGILFVDEAYMLAPKDEVGNTGAFAEESVAVLIKTMEDHKDDLIVIFAGYTDEMRKFENSNPGIASRIGFKFYFENYSAEELQQIYVQKMEKGGFSVTNAARKELTEILQYFCNMVEFGNGRGVDKAIEATKVRLGKKLAKNENADLKEIDAADIPNRNDILKRMDSSREPLDPSEKELERIAYHESGHTLVQSILFPNSPIKKLTIRAEGTGALGYMEQNSSNFGTLITRSDFKNDIAVWMAGLAAEQVFFNDYANGGSGDIRGATAQARRMLTVAGMSKYGFTGAGGEQEMKQEINEILEEGFKITLELIEANREKIQRMVDHLIKEKRDLTEQDIKAILAD